MIHTTADDVEAHLNSCDEGEDCKIRTADAWARVVAKPGHVDEVRDLMIAMHLATKDVAVKVEAVKAISAVIGALARRVPTRTLDIAESELLEDDSVVYEETATGVRVSVIPEFNLEKSN